MPTSDNASMAIWAARSVKLLIFSSTVEQLMIRTEFVLQVFLLLTVWGVVKLRRSDPMMERPYRAWGYPVTTVLFLAATGMIMGIMGIEIAHPCGF
jgi:APA family basic amino acid/polyamine antiporter